ncbi:MAG TPA: LamG-like jellyroll fold domain-containing protein, partial [Kribbella sp.]
MAQGAGYNFNSDTVSGTTVRDLAGYFCDGTIVGSAAIVSGKSGYGNALSCTGGALQIVVPADTYPVNTDGGITVAAWVQLNNNTVAARCIASAKSSALDWALYASNASGNVEMVVEGTAYSSSTSIRDGAWHHVMVVVDRTFGPGSETVKIAIDGTLVLSTTGLTTGLGYSGDTTFNVGRNANTSAQALDGIVDDFRWFTTPVEPASWSTVRDAEQQDLQYAIYPFDDGTGDDQSIYNR